MDRSNRTEKPTQKRKRDARRKGEVARSPEVASAFSLVGALIAFRAFGPNAARVLMDRSAALFADAGTLPSGTEIQRHMGAMVVATAVPILAVATVMAFSAGASQVGFRLAPEAAKPKLSHLSPRRGLERFKPAQATWELGKTALKLIVLVAITWAPLSGWVQETIVFRRLDASLPGTASVAWTLLMRAVLLAILIAGFDYTITRFRTLKQLRMTKEEVRKELKDQEGDPLVRGMRKRRQLEVSRNRMIHLVADADVVVTNPTHFAVALQYEPEEGAPRVVAKGTNRLAAKIKKEAYRNGVPVIEDRPLARALYRRTKVGQFVPTHLYEAVAVVLAMAYRRTGKVPA